MMIVSWTELVSGRVSIQGSVRLTIGVFDGLHLGHRKLMAAISEKSEVAAPVVVTFRASPAMMLGSGSVPGLILTYAQKLSRLESMGIRTVVVIDFSEEMSKLPGPTFLGLLRENLSIEKLIVGSNFRFGRNRETDTGDLREMLFDTGIELHLVEPVLHRGEVISSSWIRKSIQEAFFSEAREMLAAPYSLDLRGLRARREGKGILAMDRSEIGQVLPSGGEYGVQYTAADGSRGSGVLEINGGSITLCSDTRGEIEFVDFS
jgi:riboflavin kinase/FMN adenylyltransferase